MLKYITAKTLSGGMTMRKKIGLFSFFILSIILIFSVSAQAKVSATLTNRTSVSTDTTTKYYLKNLSSAQYAKIYIKGKASSGISIKYGSKTLSNGSLIKGTGKKLTLKRTATSS